MSGLGLAGAPLPSSSCFLTVLDSERSMLLERPQEPGLLLQHEFMQSKGVDRVNISALALGVVKSSPKAVARQAQVLLGVIRLMQGTLEARCCYVCIVKLVARCSFPHGRRLAC
jgi:hypothetical protein